MNTVIALSELLTDPVLGAVQGLAHVAAEPEVVDETTGSRIVATVRQIVGPIVILAVGLVALTYLMRRQVTQFLQFIALAVLIGVFFYSDALLAIVEFVANQFGGDGTIETSIAP